MRSLPYQNLSEYGISKVESALSLLRQQAPQHHNHILQVVQGVTYLGPDGCGENAIACTAGRYGRWVVLTSHPDSTSLVELAVTLSHEARHHYLDERGWYRVREHQCGDCSSQWEQLQDPIYQEDEQLRQHLLRAVSPPPQSFGTTWRCGSASSHGTKRCDLTLRSSCCLVSTLL